MRPVAPVVQFAANDQAAAALEAKPARQVKEADPALARASKEFEGVFVRQLLEASGIGKNMGKGAHGSMAVDALATSIGDAGGMGLARAIELALQRA